MNAIALKQSGAIYKMIWRYFKLATIGFAIGVLLYFMSGLCDYRCEYCGAKEYGRANVYHGIQLCDRCFSEFVMLEDEKERIR